MDMLCHPEKVSYELNASSPLVGNVTPNAPSLQPSGSIVAQGGYLKTLTLHGKQKMRNGKKTFPKGVSLMGANAMPTHLQGKIIPNSGEGSNNSKVHSTSDGLAKEM
jgi:hypothetical protein